MVDLTTLKQLTEELKKLENDVYNSPLFTMLTYYFNTINTRIIIFDNQKRGLFINKYGLDKFKEMGFDGTQLIGKKCPPNFCPLYGDKCPNGQCIKTKKVVTRCDVDCPLPNSKERHHVTCIPLKYNGVSGVVEIWTEVP